MPKVALPPVQAAEDAAHPILGGGLGPYAYQLLSDPGGLTQYGAFIEILPPGSRSSFRHWHETEDEMVYIPVSYTHLDVYKRQLPSLRLIWTKASRALRSTGSALQGWRR